MFHNQENYVIIKCRFHFIFIRTNLLVIWFYSIIFYLFVRYLRNIFHLFLSTWYQSSWSGRLCFCNFYFFLAAFIAVIIFLDSLQYCNIFLDSLHCYNHFPWQPSLLQFLFFLKSLDCCNFLFSLSFLHWPPPPPLTAADHHLRRLPETALLAGTATTRWKLPPATGNRYRKIFPADFFCEQDQILPIWKTQLVLSSHGLP